MESVIARQRAAGELRSGPAGTSPRREPGTPIGSGLVRPDPADVADVAAHERLGPVRVTRRDQVEQLRVLVPRGEQRLPIARRAARRAASWSAGRPHDLHQPRRCRPSARSPRWKSRSSVTCAMKSSPGAPRPRSRPPGPAGARGSAGPRHARRARRTTGTSSSARMSVIASSSSADSCAYAEPLVAHDLDEALLAQVEHRLPHRRRRHAELLREAGRGVDDARAPARRT